MTPSVKLYGRSGSDHSELAITAETQLQVALDGYHVSVPIFIQPSSDIPCLLGMNVLPLLGVKFLRSNGMSLVQEPVKTCDREAPKGIPQPCGALPTSTTTATAEHSNSSDQQVVVSHGDSSGGEHAEAQVYVVHSTYLPPMT